ncbi:MAG: GlxA family transcriptional regulator [Rhodobacteraceae bacterium]|nr:GlxA family transcriptional regulator [Paracoccaceae bacterium]
MTIYEENVTKNEKLVHVLLLPRCNMLSLAAAVDPLRSANRVAGRALYRWRFCSGGGGEVGLTAGFGVPTEPLPETPCDLLAVIAGFDVAALATPRLKRTLARAARVAARVAGIDGGGEVLARTGLLTGQRATTHWEDLEALAGEFPEIEVVRDRYVASGKWLTTGGASPCIDMMLMLIEADFGRAIAEGVARAFLYDPVHSGSEPQSLVSASRLARRSPPVARALRAMEARLETPPPIAAIARDAGLSVRRLEMLFARELGTSPAAFFRQLRLSEARRLVLSSPAPLSEIAVRCGFASLSAFSRAFSASFGTSPSALRHSAA